MATAVHVPNSTFDQNDEDRKLFVGGLSWNTTEDDLFQYFTQFGSIANVSIKYTNDGKSRGFGFITFASNGSINAVLDHGPHSVNNKVIDPRKAKNRTQTRSECKKIFLGGLDVNVLEKDIRQIFGKYGKIENVELPFDNLNQCRRRFGFVLFESPDSASAACKEPKQFVGSGEVDVRLSKPSNTTNGNNHSRQFFNNHGGAGGRSNGRPSYSNGMMYHVNNESTDYNNSNRMNSLYMGYENGQSRTYVDNMYRGHRY